MNIIVAMEYLRRMGLDPYDGAEADTLLWEWADRDTHVVAYGNGGWTPPVDEEYAP